MKRRKLRSLLAAFLSAVTVAGSMGMVSQAAEPAYEKQDPYVLGSQVAEDYEYAGYWGLATTPYESYFKLVNKMTWQGIIEENYEMTDNACLFNLISPDKLKNTPAEQRIGAWASIICYCVDVRVDINSSYSYRRVNLEDSTYFGLEAAQKLRTIVMNGITVKTAAEIQAAANAWLEAQGRAPLTDVTAEEALAAGQYAIWATANEKEIIGQPIAYNGRNPEFWSDVWNHYGHDDTFSYNVAGGEVSINSKKAEAENTKTNIEALVDYYMAMEGTASGQTAISDYSLQNAKVAYTQQTDGTYNAEVSFTIDENIDLSTAQNLTWSVIYGDTNKTFSVDHVGDYTCTLEGLADKEDIRIELNGMQKIKDVSFFDAEGVRGASQSLVAYDESTLPVHAEVTIGRDRVLNFKKTTKINDVEYPLSDISFDIYYVCTVDEFSNNYETYETPKVGDYQKLGVVTTDAAGKATFNVTQAGGTDGVYLIVEHENEAIEKVLDPFYVAVPQTTEDGSGLTYTIDLSLKNDVLKTPDVRKDINEIEKDLDSVEIGKAHTWIIRTDIPKDLKAGTSYVISDNLDYRLTYADNLLVTVAGKTAAAKSEEEAAVLVKDKDYTVTTVKRDMTVGEGEDAVVKEADTLTVTLTAAGMKKAAQLAGADYDNCELRVYFDAFADEDAQMGEEIPNQATLNYTNSVGFAYASESDLPEVYTCGLTIFKKDAKDGKTLAGAEFKLARKATEAEIADPEVKTSTLVTGLLSKETVVYVDFYDNQTLTGEKKDTAVTGNDGYAYFYGLKDLVDDKELQDGEAEYYLVETKAPAGYNLLSYPVKVKVNQVSHLDANKLEIANSNGFKLPETGGMGTAVFTAGGAMLASGAGAVLVMKKKKEDEE